MSGSGERRAYPARTPLAGPSGGLEALVGRGALGVGRVFGADAVEEIHLGRGLALDLERAARLGLEQLAGIVERARGDVDAPGRARRLEPLRQVHGVAPDVEGEAPLADDAGNRAAGVDADAHLPRRQAQFLALAVRAREIGLDLERGETGIDRMRAARLGHAADREIGVADGFERLEPMARHDLVELREVIVELLHEAGRLHVLGEPREAGEVGEHDRRRLVMARLHAPVRLEFLGDGRRQDVAQQLVRALLLRGRGRARRLELAQRRVALQQLAAQLELRHRLLREAAHRFALRRREFPRLEIDHAQGAEREAFGVDQRHAAIEPRMGLAGDRRQAVEALVLQEIRHIHQVVLRGRRGADHDIARTFVVIGGQAVFGLEPIACLVDEADHGHRALADLRRKLGDRVVGEFGRRAQDLIGGQRGDARVVVGRRRQRDRVGQVVTSILLEKTSSSRAERRDEELRTLSFRVGETH